ncbi:N-acetyltransferase family protein [Glutamicibacter endophyticus]|uniref:GNAT family N-acetyltransferase n=1 Tax=Glutamicibacter endophyticus TaxID=1522174 RepID=UPI003AF11B4F
MPPTSPAVAQFEFRPLAASDAPILLEATTANLNWCGERFTAEQVRSTPELAHYCQLQPDRGDYGILAIDAHQRWAGVAWVVYLPATDPGYGFIAPDIGELSLCVHAAFRGQGLGRELLRRAVAYAEHRGERALSLSVEAENFARELYFSEGFVPAPEATNAGTMIKSLGARR